MSQNNNILILGHDKKKNLSSDRDKIVYAYHYLEQGNIEEAKDLLSRVSSHYYESGMYKDLSRALLCQLTYQTTNHHAHGKEAEFYLIIYRLTKYLFENKVHFTGSGNFFLMRDQLFRDLM